MQQTLLEQTSEYFQKAIKNERLGGDQNIGILKYPQDDTEVWKLLLFWMMKGHLPTALWNRASQSHQDQYQPIYALLIKCWAAGDQYLMPEFQNNVMIIMLYLLELSAAVYTTPQTLSWPNIKLAFEVSAPGSKLRNLSCLFLGDLIYPCDDLMEVEEAQYQHLGCLEGIPGALLDFIRYRDSALLSRGGEDGRSKAYPRYLITRGIKRLFLVRDECYESRTRSADFLARQWHDIDTLRSLPDYDEETSDY